MKIVNTHEAKTRLSALLAAIEDEGEVVVICRHGRPVAEMRAYRPAHNVSSINPRLQPVTSSDDGWGPLPALAGLPSSALDPADS